MERICPKCGYPTNKVMGAEFCPRFGCGWHKIKGNPDTDDEREVVPEKTPDASVLEPLSRIHSGRIVDFQGHSFIAKDTLEMYEDYYDHRIGLVISVMGPGKGTIFFELAGVVSRGHDSGYLLIRIDPDTEFDHLPTLDVDPEDATILGQEEDQGSDEAP